MRQTPAAKTEVSTGSHLPCKLDTTTQDLIKLIFDNDMFNDAMKNLEIGVLFRHYTTDSILIISV